MVKRSTCPGVVTFREGFTLPELLLALALTILLILGLVQIVAAASAANSLQNNQSQIQDRARIAVGVLSQAIRQAGFRPEPWNEAYEAVALTGDNLAAATASGDRLAVRAWSDLNCFDNRNPVLDSEGNPRFYVRESIFDLTGDHNLALLCRYGPNSGELTTQVRRQGLLPGVESFQVLYGEDADRDGNVEHWVEAGDWNDPQQVLGVRIGLLLASEDPVAPPLVEPLGILDASITTPPDGRLRRVVEFAVAIRGRIW